MWLADRGKTHANPHKHTKKWQNEKKMHGDGMKRNRVSAKCGVRHKAAESLSVITWASREQLMCCGGIHNVKKSAQQSASTENDLCFILNKVIQSHRWYVSSASLQFSNCVFIRARSLPHKHTHAFYLSLSFDASLSASLMCGWANRTAVAAVAAAATPEPLLYSTKSEFLDNQTKKEVRKSSGTHTRTHKRNALTNSTRAIMFIYV